MLHSISLKKLHFYYIEIFYKHIRTISIFSYILLKPGFWWLLLEACDGDDGTLKSFMTATITPITTIKTSTDNKMIMTKPLVPANTFDVDDDGLATMLLILFGCFWPGGNMWTFIFNGIFQKEFKKKNVDFQGGGGVNEKKSL